MRGATLFAALSISFAAAGGAAGATPGPSFKDASGDAGGAPDITLVTVNSNAGGVTFVIRTADAASWANAAAILDIDADAKPATGNAGGATGIELSYVLHSLHDQFTLDRSNGESIPHPQATATLSGRTLTIAVPFSELGTSSRIGFFVETPGPTGEDRAPNASAWQFSPGARVASISPSFSPRGPRHGHTFALAGVKTLFSDGTSGTTAATCTAKLGTARLSGNCRWRVPASARGKKLTVAVRAAGLVKMVRFTVH